GGVDFLEVYAGKAGLTAAARRAGLITSPPLDRAYPSFGRSWDFERALDRTLLAWLVRDVLKPKVLHVGTPCEKFSRIGQQDPGAMDMVLAEFSRDLLLHQGSVGGVGTLENPVGSLLFELEMFTKRFGTVQGPKRPWSFVRTDGCQYGLVSQDISDGSLDEPMEKGQLWLGNVPSGVPRSPDADFQNDVLSG
ncbi:unnamed protein product, partial [Effrenium voratum]